MQGRYLLDANAFIEAKRRYYAFDICPGFWDAVCAHCNNDRLYSIDRVRLELLRGKDELVEWVAKQAPKALFLSTDDGATMQQFAQMMSWVQAQEQFQPAAKSQFAQAADGWLAAYAKAHGFVVVTHEVANPEVKRKVPLPNLCAAFEVPYLDTFDMLRALETRFGWLREGPGRSS